MTGVAGLGRRDTECCQKCGGDSNATPCTCPPEDLVTPAPSKQPRELTVILREIAIDPDKHSPRTIAHWCDIAAKELDDLVAEVKQLRSCKRQLVDHQIILAELTMRLDTLKEQGRINTVPVTELYKAAGEFNKLCGTWEPIPRDVYWNQGLNGFYHQHQGYDMGRDFFRRWAGRKHEFPGALVVAEEIPNAQACSTRARVMVGSTEQGFHAVDTSALEMKLVGAAMHNQWPADLRPCDARVPEQSRDSTPATGGMSGDQHESPMDEALKEFNQSIARPATAAGRTCQMCGLMIHRNSTVPVCGSCYPRYQVIQSMPKLATVDDSEMPPT